MVSGSGQHQYSEVGKNKIIDDTFMFNVSNSTRLLGIKLTHRHHHLAFDLVGLRKLGFVGLQELLA